MKFKKIYILLIFIFLGCSLWGCSNTNEEETIIINQDNETVSLNETISENEANLAGNVSDNYSICETDNVSENKMTVSETTLSRDELFMAFCNGEINAYEILEDGSFGNININNYQLAGSISENEIIDMTVYLKNSEPIDLDNDGECEYLLYNPVYGYMCFDCKDGKVICFAHGEGKTAVCSYTWYNEECWIVHGDTTHEGRCMYKLSKYNGNLDIVSSFEIGWTDWDGDGNASYYMDDMELTKEQYEEYINQIFK